MDNGSAIDEGLPNISLTLGSNSHQFQVLIGPDFYLTFHVDDFECG